ncbi:hypothetical protein [Lysobacter sp. Root916]|uniref:hypothetical protein n=1 Tax=Lysobacter sp. Root916 TaxID=1736606 RepID=UPI000AF59683|nr:hypothetical protein [Lysobacter sp. Root916]
MSGPNPNLQGKSFLWAFFLFVALFFTGAILGGFLGLSREWSAVLVAAAGFIPMLTQAVTGYALDRSWRARFNREEHPARFRVMLLLSSIIAAMFTYAAYSVYIAAPKGDLASSVAW